jgi:transcription antitermination factor NusG
MEVSSMLDSQVNDARPVRLPLARGPPLASIASCGSCIEIPEVFKFSTGHGGSRAGAGRPRKSPERDVMPDDVSRWYCIRTAFGAEKTADTAVRLDGFTVFNPSIFKKATPPRRDAAGVMRPGKPDRVGPLLVRYFFVELNLADPYWYQIKRLPGVDRVMSGADLDAFGSSSPIAIPDRALAHLRSLLELNDCYYPDKLRDTKIEPGVPLVLTDGPLIGRTGTCDESDGLEVRLALLVMGHLVHVTVPQSSVGIVKAE